MAGREFYATFAVPKIRPDKTGLKFTQKEDLNSGRKHNTTKPGCSRSSCNST
jgi:hypothetical protein